MRWKVREWAGASEQLGGAIEFAIEVSIGRESILDVESLAVGIALGLLHAPERIIALLLRLKHGHGERLRHVTHLHAQQIVCPTLSSAAAPLGASGFHRRRRDTDFQGDVVTMNVAFLAKHRVYQMESRVCFIHAHDISPFSFP